MKVKEFVKDHVIDICGCIIIGGIVVLGETACYYVGVSHGYHAGIKETYNGMAKLIENTIDIKHF